MAKTINDKLKESVQKSLAQAKKSKPEKKTEAEFQAEHEDFLKSIGVRSSTERRQMVTVYTLQYHNRARLDHTKYPNERMHQVENSPIFATYNEADKEVRKREKADSENLYFPHMTSVYVDQVPAKLLKKLKERGWGFHS